MNKCICIGSYAGIDITDEDLLFCLTNTEDGELVEYRTTMTEDEFEIINEVVRRALKNKKSLKMTKQPNKANEKVEFTTYDLRGMVMASELKPIIVKQLNKKLKQAILSERARASELLQKTKQLERARIEEEVRTSSGPICNKGRRGLYLDEVIKIIKNK